MAAFFNGQTFLLLTYFCCRAILIRLSYHFVAKSYKAFLIQILLTVLTIVSIYLRFEFTSSVLAEYLKAIPTVILIKTGIFLMETSLLFILTAILDAFWANLNPNCNQS